MAGHEMETTAITSQNTIMSMDFVADFINIVGTLVARVHSINKNNK